MACIIWQKNRTENVAATFDQAAKHAGDSAEGPKLYISFWATTTTVKEAGQCEYTYRNDQGKYWLVETKSETAVPAEMMNIEILACKSGRLVDRDAEQDSFCFRKSTSPSGAARQLTLSLKQEFNERSQIIQTLNRKISKIVKEVNEL